jgi:hypothetical protein
VLPALRQQRDRSRPVRSLLSFLGSRTHVSERAIRRHDQGRLRAVMATARRSQILPVLRLQGSASTEACGPWSLAAYHTGAGVLGALGPMTGIGVPYIVDYLDRLNASSTHASCSSLSCAILIKAAATLLASAEAIAGRGWWHLGSGQGRLPLSSSASDVSPEKRATHSASNLSRATSLAVRRPSSSSVDFC